MSNHDALIETLSRSATPVRRAAPAWRRALTWIGWALPSGALAGLLLHRGWTDWSQPGAPRAGLGLVVAFALGAWAMTGAFDLSIAGRKVPAGRLFAAALVAWLTASLVGLVMSGAQLGPLRAGLRCYAFMLVAGAPMALAAILSLRQTPSLRPVRTLAVAGIGVALMSLALLALCHPTKAWSLDFLMHLAAGATIVAGTVLAGRRQVALG